MRYTLIVLLSCIVSQLHSQAVSGFKAAIDDPKKKIEAIHHYPKNVKDGECHHVEIISVNVSGNTITIVEQWENWLGAKAKTTLTGQLVNNVASGQWKSNYSGGSWTYDFSNNTGTWNKTKSTFDSFDNFYKLEFKIIDNAGIVEGFQKCSAH